MCDDRTVAPSTVVAHNSHNADPRETVLIVRTIQNAQIHCGSRMQSFGTLKEVVNMVISVH
jgi:hypothetical protein